MSREPDKPTENLSEDDLDAVSGGAWRLLSGRSTAVTPSKPPPSPPGIPVPYPNMTIATDTKK